jgi:succinyl-CoA synthetase alpha subunit
MGVEHGRRGQDRDRARKGGALVSILLDKNTRVLVQGITGRDGSFHTRAMKAYGTRIVGGVTPGKGGQYLDEVPVFDTMRDAVDATGAAASCIYVPAAHAPNAILEASEAGVELVVCITEGIPVLDMVKVMPELTHRGTRLLGPNCPGLITPGESKIGIMPGHITAPGPVGLVSRSGTLTYEVVWQLTQERLGQTTCVGIGGDPIIGTTFLDTLKLYEADGATECVVLIGEIGGSDEEEAARFIARSMTKPVVAFIAGQTAPPGRRMGHAGAIVTGSSGTAESKIQAFREAGVEVARTPSEIRSLARRALGARSVTVTVSAPAAPVAPKRSAAPANPNARPAAAPAARKKAAAASKKKAPSKSRKKASTRPKKKAAAKPKKKAAAKKKSPTRKRKTTAARKKAAPKKLASRKDASPRKRAAQRRAAPRRAPTKKRTPSRRKTK